jgi:preprotein translocase SecE subunit
MSAQRRTTVKDKEPVPAAAAAPVKASSSKATAPSSQRAKDKPVDKSKAGDAHQSVIAARTDSLRQFIRDSMSEMRKVNWPDQQTARNLTFLVIGISVVLGIALGGIDFLLEKLFEAMT